jgi:hypothetical protein
MSTDPWSVYRSLLRSALDSAVDEIGFSHGELVREQVGAAVADESELPALLCLRVAEAVGGNASVALPAATAFALLTEMSRVLLSLESAPSLSTAWGMPRALNAGDAFFAAAQDALLSSSEELTAEGRLAAVRILDAACRDFLEALYARAEGGDSPKPLRILYPAAVALGAIAGGAGGSTLSGLDEFAPRLNDAAPAELERLLAGEMMAAIRERR